MDIPFACACIRQGDGLSATRGGRIADEDARIGSRKSEISLFDAYMLAVKNTECPAIGGEASVQAGARAAQSIGAFLPRVYLRALKGASSDQRARDFELRPAAGTSRPEKAIDGLIEQRWDAAASPSRA